MASYEAPKAPTWWKGTTTTNKELDVANAVLPYLSPEDQINLKQQLSQRNAAFAGYGAADVRAPTQITPELRNSFLSSERASNTASALTNLAATYGGASAMGTGFSFLQNAVSLLNKYGAAAGAMSRESYQQFQSDAQALLSSAQSDSSLAPYAALASMFLSPTFSAGELSNVRKSASGNLIYGTPSGKLYV